MTAGGCSIEGCTRQGRVVRGWCLVHYKRWRRHGDPRADVRIVGDDLARLMSKVDVDGVGCWPWRGAMNAAGYGIVRAKGRTMSAHRWVYEVLAGSLLLDMTLDHLCRNTACVNPDHMEQVPAVVNLMRGGCVGANNARKVRCPKGHPYDDANTLVSSGARRCRECKQRSRL